ncbi:MAG: DUF4340 domain-containing protein [Deltaproteobacteria bacterium]|nr:DUF4340 domain-containing protein [Deltaproteobacteria bacterium]
MSPRRLIPYLVIFLVLAGTYAGLRWHQAQKEAREAEAKQVFDFKADEISAVTLKREQSEIHLTRQGSAWEITKPLKAGADARTAGDLVKTLAQLRMERDLGPGDLRSFGLDKPGLVVSFTAKGQPHLLSLGSPVPGGRGFYVRQDERPNILLIAEGVRDSLDQSLDNLRDKTLWVFAPDRVKSVKLRTGKTEVNLEKHDGSWTWVGRPNFKVRSDRVEQLLRQLHEARITAFPPAPQDLKAAALGPLALTEVSVATPQGVQTLLIGAKINRGYYARVGDQGPVVQVGGAIPEEIARTIPALADRRLWSGALREVGRIAWGTPGKTWTAAKEKDFWKLTGPDKAEIKQSAPRVEMALVDFQNLEYSSLLPPSAAPGKEASFLELFDGAGKLMFRLDELGQQGQAGVGVRTQTGDTVMNAVVPQQSYNRWHQEMARLTTPPPQPKK